MWGATVELVPPRIVTLKIEPYIPGPGSVVRIFLGECSYKDGETIVYKRGLGAYSPEKNSALPPYFLLFLMCGKTMKHTRNMQFKHFLLNVSK